MNVAGYACGRKLNYKKLIHTFVKKHKQTQSNNIIFENQRPVLLNNTLTKQFSLI